MSPPPPLSPDLISLAGVWRFSLDRVDAGINEQWFAQTLPGSITLPGNLAAQGLGDEVSVATAWTGSIFDPSYFTAVEYAKYREPGNIKVPFFLQPEKHYVGPAWYQREIQIPPGWAGKRIVLTLERPHWETRVWLDQEALGQNDSLSIPHVYVLGTNVAPGPHALTIRVDNRYLIEIGPNSHSITDHTQGNWNGIVGALQLTATPLNWIEDLQVYPRVATRSVLIKGQVGSATKTWRETAVELTSPSGNPRSALLDQNGAFKIEYALNPDAELWDEFNPALHRITATLPNGDSRTVTFGLREISAEGTQFTLNGKRIFLRGTLECAIFPKTGHPPTEVEPWKRILEIARAHGLNHLRFHSWCPPEAAFVAGDEMGFYFQIEAGSWPNQGTTVGDGRNVDVWLIEESERILRTYGNHPSFLFLAAGNEPHGDHSHAWLASWVERMRASDARRLYTCSAGWPELKENQYHVTHHPRMHQWLDHLKSRINAQPPETCTDYRDFIAARGVPVVSHEIGQWCVYPNFNEVEKYTGYLKPRNFEIFRQTLAEHGMIDQAEAFLYASGKLQALCYKEEIESALRTPGMGGFQLLDLHDFPGQGTALVGVLDAFWEEKGYIPPTEYRRFAGPTVPLARLAKRVFTTGETLDAEIEVSHFGRAPLAAAVPTWKLMTFSGAVLASGMLPAHDIPFGTAFPLGRISVDLAAVPAPAQCKLIVSIGGADAINDWDLWVYPKPIEIAPSADVLLVSELDDETITKLTGGAKVLLTIPPGRVAPDPIRGKIELGFSSIFWNTAWTNQQAPHTLGILCDPQHPALAEFPTEAHSNWQWWFPVMNAGAMILDGLPPELRPIVQVIDDWFTNRKLGLLFEARVGEGKLLVCSIDLARADNPVIPQLRASLLQYIGSSAFAPRVALMADQVKTLMR